ncbi:plasmid mobilization relaxosome protein MobC, partial [Escherichia coli]|nr:plasmid mobilization relaxosome protein MobC [Escherichia coli]
MPPCKGDYCSWGVMIPMKRERMLTIRVTDDEHARLLERCEGKQLAV